MVKEWWVPLISAIAGTIIGALINPIIAKLTATRVEPVLFTKARTPQGIESYRIRVRRQEGKIGYGEMPRKVAGRVLLRDEEERILHDSYSLWTDLTPYRLDRSEGFNNWVETDIYTYSDLILFLILDRTKEEHRLRFLFGTPPYGSLGTNNMFSLNESKRKGWKVEVLVGSENVKNTFETKV